MRNSKKMSISTDEKEMFEVPNLRKFKKKDQAEPE